ncbi:MAG: ECF transporter S component [Clostridia bacterium]|nr:ECF transporter S component [Clostridia bacterium]
MATTQSRMTRTKTIALLGLMLALTVVFCFVPIQFGPITLALMILPTLIVAQVCGGWTSFIMGLMMGILNLIAWYTTKAASPIAPIFQNPLICILPRVLIAVVAYWSRRGMEALIIKKWMKINPQPVEMVDDDDDDAEIAEINVDNNDFDTQNADCDETDVNEAMDESIEVEDEPVLDEPGLEAENKKSEKSKKAKEIAVRQAIHFVSTALGVITNTLFVAIFTLIFFNNTILGGTIINVEYVLAWFSLNFAIEVVAFSLVTPPVTLAIKAAKLV